MTRIVVTSAATLSSADDVRQLKDGLKDQGWEVKREARLLLSTAQASTYHQDEDVFGIGPVLALEVAHADEGAQPNFDGLSEVYCGDKDIETLRDRLLFFPEVGRRTRTVAIFPEDQGVKAITTRLQGRGFLTLYRESRSVPAEMLQTGKGLVFVLERANAVDEVKLLTAPDLREGVPVYVSGSEEQARKDIQTLLPDGIPIEQTLALIKPHATSSGYADGIREAIVQNGFTVVQEKQVQLNLEDAKRFYIEHEGREFYIPLARFMSSAPLHALVLSRTGAIKAWRSLCGPTNSFNAKKEAPSTIRARFGTDGRRNAVHGSDSEESAAREIQFYFGDRERSMPSCAEVKELLTGGRSKQILGKEMLGDIPSGMYDTIVDALTALAVAKPSDDPRENIRWLGKWLLNNNPNNPIVEEACLPEVQKSVAEQLAEMNNVKEIQVIFVVGGPGAHSEEVCGGLIDLGFTPLSAKRLQRDEWVERGMSRKRGEVAQPDKVVELLELAMLKSKSWRFVLQDFPRNLDLALLFESRVAPVGMVLNLDTPENIRRERTREKGEAGDIADQIANFHTHSVPVIQHYARFGKVRSIDGSRHAETLCQQARDLAAAHIAS